ncbi:MAG: hypothetical protein M1814_002696 [Vezdaea aestivalis]|nr:MAG: hypothetical protein M1814_002696 [Vezdaea aestivalis]
MAHSAQSPMNGSRSSIHHYPPSSAAHLIDKNKINARRSTPDSEAMASSDDDQDSRHLPASVAHPPEPMHASKTMRPTRRSSWLNDLPAPNRKPSFTGATNFSPTNSQPSTPAAEAASKAGSSGSGTSTVIGRNAQMPSSFNWGTGIWSNDPRKDPPARLAEVIPSPTSVVPPSSFVDAELSSPVYRDMVAESNIPFAIPLHPTPKTYRSQSYSVGQFEPETAGGSPSGPSANAYLINNNVRLRSTQPSGLQHRPSRPSMLSEMSSDGPALGQLQEVDDDEEESDIALSAQSSKVQSLEERTIRLLAEENAKLRQQAAANESREHRLRHRPLMSSQGSNSALRAASDSRSIQGSLPEEGSDYAVDEHDDIHELQALGRQMAVARRFSEAQVDHQSHLASMGIPVNNKLENLKKGHWQSSLGFGGLEEIPQSRRHSFAEASNTRHLSTSSSASMQGLGVGIGMGAGVNVGQDRASMYSDGGSATQLPAENRESQVFHSRFGIQQAEPQDGYLQAAQFAADYFSMQGHYNRLLTDRANPAPPFHQSRANQVLHLVTFKCSRADIFYIPEGTGLQVKPGDLVVVEADRGTDLGTVIHADVTWERAKQIKESHAEDHYRWLMMFSRHHSPSGTAGGVIQGSAPSGSAIGGMGPQGGQNGGQDLGASEFKPKMIKRLAQAHEIQALKDKEGNEAKAKRVCQQKVVEHRLHMEILDAEFQMDWKKLTFFYYADAYINFNTLVTDLFKVYKTRIWMSAVNPASFANPSQSLLPPSGVGPGAIGVGHDYNFDQRRRKESPPYNAGHGVHGTGAAQDQRSNTASYQSSPIQQNNFSYTFQPFGQLPRQTGYGMNEYPVAQAQPGASPYALNQYPAPNGRGAYPQFGAQPGMGVSPRNQNYPSGQDYIDTFQALSLRGMR